MPVPPEDELRALAERLVDARHRADALRDTLAEFREEDEPQRVLRELQRLETLIREEHQAVEALEQDVRAAVVEHTKTTGDTDPLGNQAAYTKTFSTAEYDEDHAIEWCYAHQPDLLSFNRKGFELVAKQRGLDWVKWSMEPRGYISSSLGAKLDSPEWTRRDSEDAAKREQYKAIEPEAERH